jgi:hypothetical protein
MDIHLSLRYGNLETAQRFIDRIFFFCSILLFLIISIILYIFQFHPYLLAFNENLLLSFFLLFIIQLVCKSFFEIYFRLAIATKNELKFSKIITFVFLVIGAPSQYLLLVQFDYNLQAFILFDSLLLFLVTIYLRRRLNLEESLLLKIALKSSFNKRKGQDFFAWKSQVKILQQLQIPLEYALVVMSPNYKSSYFSNYLSNKFKLKEDNLLLLTAIMPGLYLLVGPKLKSSIALKYNREFAGYIETIKSFSEATDIFKVLIEIKTSY